MIDIAITGSVGRMGQTLVQMIAQQSDTLRLTQATVLPDDLALGNDIGLLASGKLLGVVTQVKLAAAGFDVAIDFTSPAASLEHLACCAEAGKAIVIGTTGFDDVQRELLLQYASKIPVVFAANYSIGVTLSLQLLKQASRVLSDDYDVEIYEAHHRYKKDAPSGTALKMGEVIAAGRQVALKDVAVYSRDGFTEGREKGSIGFACVRAGDIVGDHTVTFATEGERLEITHKASSRSTFAKGAIRAAIWAVGKPAGLYSMDDVLGFTQES
ncbi:MAG: 4-hydroxy-tetrahydrodipicolinate reductase [Pseudohongiellaceae bacterium]|jgi:4-hydroxy-tetrahydrodipicolinate reductase